MVLNMKQFAILLEEKELVILRERLLADDPLTLTEIEERDGITRERLQQIERRVRKKLRTQHTLNGQTRVRDRTG